ncbi:MAG: heparinase II/III family protein [Gammaproteobacteria bacterium]|nr:heparinase II/III family protein [Gammaproteobacteria bacterium]
MRFVPTIFAAFLVLVSVPCSAEGQERPRLGLTADEVAEINASPDAPGLFGEALASTRAAVNPWLDETPDIPLPADAGGGYTHEQHKRNQRTMLGAGQLYRLTGDEDYARLAARMLDAYATMYPELGEHPMKKEQSPGRLFWQSLNEAVWLVTVIQAYDAIYDWLPPGRREHLESGLFRPMAEFLSRGQPQTFDKIHNHGTWAVAAVGMTGYVLDEPEYVEIALLGLKKDGSAGFIRQLDELFSPDGYYSEGPYYQRYALLPFVLFAQAIERNEPRRGIFEHRDGILLKAVDATIQLSYNGLFFPINDAIKDKGIDTAELVYGVSIAFARTRDPSLLTIAQRQGRTVLSVDGFRLAKALQDGQATSYPFRSRVFTDGPAGEQGALMVLRSGEEHGHQAVIFKATAQGMGHGHFDRLAWLFYDNGNEIVPDYGAARYLNVEAKYGGHYLPENNTWAKQTVAHSTLVVDEASQFSGDWKRGMEFPPRPLMFATGDRLDIAAARMEGAYDGVRFTRVLAMLKNGPFSRPAVVDLMRVKSGETHRYDLPLHFRGQVMSINRPLDASTQSMQALGQDNGYQHLWARATAQVPAGELLQLTWLNEDRFYTHTALAGDGMNLVFAQTGADDPDFNLRHEQALLQRVSNADDHVFVSILEAHGKYDGAREYTTESASNLADLVYTADGNRELVRITARNGAVATLALAPDSGPDDAHRLEYDGTVYEWTGPYHLFDN